MEIKITRHSYSVYGVDGTLCINNKYVCDTCENLFDHIASGTYTVRLKHNRKLGRKVPYIIDNDIPSDKSRSAPFIRIGNGCMNLHDRSVIVGERILKGVLLHSSKCFSRIIDRLDKVQERGYPITITFV